jgi:hypothetical protein
MQVEKEETVFYAAIKWLQARLHTRHNSLLTQLILSIIDRER